jgi:hypothetical protein
MAKVTGLLPVLLLATIVGSTGPVIAKDDLVQHTMRCPQTVEFRVNWQDKISSDPPFTVRKQAESTTHRAQISRMERSGQRITCFYNAGGGFQAGYDYHVERTIISCRAPTSGIGSGKQMQCDLKP